MAIPAINPFAAKPATHGKAATAQGGASASDDFSSTLAQQKAGSATSDKAPQPSPTTSAAPRPAAKQEPAEPQQGNAPSDPEGISAKQRIADATPIELPGDKIKTIESALGRLTANNAVADNADETANAHGIANALEQLQRNPGLGLGLTAKEPEAPGEHLATKDDKDRSASLLDTNVDAPLLAAPLTFPPSTSPIDIPAEQGDELLSGRFSIGAHAETALATANLAGESNPAPPAAAGNFAATLAAQQATSSASAAAAPPHVETPLHTPGWGGNFSEGVVWMAKSEIQSAQITINPPQLGPVQVTLHLNGDQASALFASPHAEVRQAIQDALPQLRDMMAASGINLGQADVGSQGSAAGREFAAQQGNGNRYQGENAILPPDAQFADNAPVLPVQRGRGLVDLFA